MKTQAPKQPIKITLLLEEQALILNTFQDKRFSDNHLARSLCHKLLFLIPDQLPEALLQTGDSCRHPDQSPVAVVQDGNQMDHYFCEECCSYPCKCPMGSPELLTDSEFLSGYKYVPKDNELQVSLSAFQTESCFQCSGFGTQIHSDEPCCCCSGTGKRIVEFCVAGQGA